MFDISSVLRNNLHYASGNETVASYIPNSISSLSELVLSITSIPAVRDSAKLFFLGLSIESTRRLLSIMYTYCVDSFFVTAEFDERDETFTWVMFWLSRHPSLQSSRYIIVTTHRFGQSGVSDSLPGEKINGKPVDPRKCVQYLPTYDKIHHLWHRGSWISIRRSRTQGDMWNRKGDEKLVLTVLARRVTALDSLLLEAKQCYKRDSEGRIKIYVSDSYNEWQVVGSRPKRPLSSVVLAKGVKERLLSDAKDFLDSEKWYAERGIPWRRGYLLYGSPGAGKTSLSKMHLLGVHADSYNLQKVHSLAGELNLDIYVVSLSKKGLDDTTLNELITKVPSRSLVLMEDIDAAFFRGITREGGDAGPEPENPGQESIPTSAVTLSGLLGAIDGVAAQEGRILFATTNKYSALDPALVRPGRLDVHVQFEHAGKWQIEELFRCFFPPNSESHAHQDLNNHEKESEAQANDYRLTQCELDSLAKTFAERIPEREFSMAAIQGLLMQYKVRPQLAVEEATEWVEAERKKRKKEGSAIKHSPHERVVMTTINEEVSVKSSSDSGLGDTVDDDDIPA